MTGLILAFAVPLAANASLILGVIPQGAVVAGQPVILSVALSGLGNQQPPSLGAYDLQFWYNPMILGSPNVLFGDPVLGDQLALTVPAITCSGAVPACSSSTPTQPGPNLTSIEVTETSLDSPTALDSTQPGGFTLFTIGFQTLQAGTSQLALSDVLLSDSGGAPLTPNQINGTSLTVTSGSAIPEPNAGLLALSGMTVLLAWRRFRSKITG